MSQTIFHAQSAIVLLLIYVGLFYRKNPKKHIPIMKTAMLWDILLILQIEFSRQAIATAMQPMVNKALLNFHIVIATLCVVLYVILYFLGSKVKEGKRHLLPFHRVFGGLCVLLRTAVLVTAYLIETHNQGHGPG